MLYFSNNFSLGDFNKSDSVSLRLVKKRKALYYKDFIYKKLPIKGGRKN